MHAQVYTCIVIDDSASDYESWLMMTSCMLSKHLTTETGPVLKVFLWLQNRGKPVIGHISYVCLLKFYCSKVMSCIIILFLHIVFRMCTSVTSLFNFSLRSVTISGRKK